MPKRTSFKFTDAVELLKYSRYQMVPMVGDSKWYNVIDVHEGKEEILLTDASLPVAFSMCMRLNEGHSLKELTSPVVGSWSNL